MVSKLLTNVTRIVQQSTTTAVVLSESISRTESAREWFEKSVITTTQHKALPFINIQRLMTYQNIINLMRNFPTTPLPERRAEISHLLRYVPEEEELLTKKLTTRQQLIVQQQRRRHVTRVAKVLDSIVEKPAPPIALNLIDHTALCTLDSVLYELYPDQLQLIVQQLVQMCEKKAKFISVMVGYEALQKQLLQLYVPNFMNFPFTLNMLAMRITALSRQALLNKSMTVYIMGASQASMLKTKYTITPADFRRIESKYVSSGKPESDAVPEKFSVGYTERLTEEEKVGLIRNMKGKELPFMALRYAYSMPYWLRRFIAIHMGYPENAKYALYFGIGGLPTRRSTWRYDFLKYSEAKYLNYSADEHVRNLIKKIQTKRGHFLKRYGKYYRKRRI
jgi:hypothetical protein